MALDLAQQIVFLPLLPWWVIAASAALAAVVVVLGAARHNRGSLWRFGAFAVLIAFLANPQWRVEDRTPVDDVALVFVDESESQSIGERREGTEAARADLLDALAAFEGIEVREVSLKSDSWSGSGTELTGPLAEAMADVPRDRLAGVFLITDGQIEDAAGAEPLLADSGVPFHASISGEPGEVDRRLRVIEAPSYAIVGEAVPLRFIVEDLSADDTRRAATIRVSIDGEPQFSGDIATGEEVTLDLVLDHAGANVIEIDAAPLPGELTDRNNSAVISTNGVRDRLRVLLVSGEPHPGQRAWRDLLKSDPSVDLVHFTILRPPEKHDGTPIGELSLIAFPTRELFSEKLNEFDLVIFDRYRRRGVLPITYLANVARYVEEGGAVLTASGPEFASPFSLYRSPLATILPTQPTGMLTEQGFKPLPTDAGERHPITEELAAAGAEPDWGRWFRLVDAKPDSASGQVLMEGPDEKPLVVVDRVGDGRVAAIMSDQMWLWSRGFEGGGPQAPLLRRLAHWLMKEPDLEEERLTAVAEGGRLVVEGHTMGDSFPVMTVTTPSGRTLKLPPDQIAPGRYRAEIEADEAGLYRVEAGDLSAVAGAGALNAVEFADVRSTDGKLAPLAEATGGGVARLSEGGVPDLREIGPGDRVAAGAGWLGVRRNAQYTVDSVSQTPLLYGPVALVLAVGLLMLGWRAEGR